METPVKILDIGLMPQNIRKEWLKSFLNNAGESLNHFRYYAKRPFDVIQNHVYTILAIDAWDNAIGYGHLDKEGDRIWLGIAVSHNKRGKGIGKQVMNALLKFTDEQPLREIWLSVDNDNLPAINLYTKLGFEVIEQRTEITMMKRKTSRE